MTLEEKEIKLIELCQKKFKDKVLDEEVFYLLLHIECYKYGLDNYVNGLSITKLPKLTLGTYDIDKKTIELNSKYFF